MLQEIKLNIGKGSVGIESRCYPSVVIIVNCKIVTHFKIGELPKITSRAGAVILCKTFRGGHLIIDDVIKTTPVKVSVDAVFHSFDALAESSES